MAAQTIEDRLASLEAQVAELWQIHDRVNTPDITVSAELVGNEHQHWGYPGGECDVRLNDYFITCHDGGKRIPIW